MIISTHTSVSFRTEGAPEVSISDHDGELQIYPTGVANGPCLFMSVENWRDLNVTVEAAIEERLSEDSDDILPTVDELAARRTSISAE